MDEFTRSLSDDLTEMEIFAWMSMTEDEFVKALAPEAWKRAPRAPAVVQSTGRAHASVGLTEAKVQRLVARFTKGRTRADRSRLCSLVFREADRQFTKLLDGWAWEVHLIVEKVHKDNQRLSYFEKKTANVRKIIRDLEIPLGARKPVYDYLDLKGWSPV